MSQSVRNDSTSARDFWKYQDLASLLRNPKSQRLDIRKVSELFGLSIDELARALSSTPAWLCKHPDAVALQSKLEIYERIARALARLVGTQEGLRIWLNTKCPDLDGEAPVALLRQGDGETVAELLEDALLGQPG